MVRNVPGVQGPWGTPVPMVAPSAGSGGMTLSQLPQPPMLPGMMPPGAMMAGAGQNSSGIVQAGYNDPNSGSGIVRAGGMMPTNGGNVIPASGNGMPPGMMMMQPGGGMSPPGIPPPPGVPCLPPGMTMGGPGMGGPGMGGPGMGMMPGMGGPGMPGMGGPGMGMMPGMLPPGMQMPGAPNGIMQASCPPPGAVALAPGVGAGPGAGACGPPKRTEVRFSGPAGMKVSWYSCGPDGHPTFGGNQLEAPGRYNFLQAAIYRLKLSDIPGRPGVDLYPTLEIVPANFKTDAFLAHSAVPVYFTEEDLDAVAGGNYLVKVIYLPFPQYADVANTGPDEVVSTRLEPGADPIAEACKRGSILAVVRVGNIDLEVPNTPSMDAPPSGGGCCNALPSNAIQGPAIARTGGLPSGPGMPMMVPGMPVARPGAMLPNGGQLPAQPLNVPAGPALNGPPAAPPTGPVGQMPSTPSQPVQPVWYKVPVPADAK